MGAVVDEVNGPSNEHVKVALNHGHKLLTIQEFIDVTKFVMVNYFWQVVVDGRCTHMGTPTIKWFGYEGTDRCMKQKFVDMLKRNNIPYRELKNTDEDVKLYPTIQEEMRLLPNQGAITKQKWLVMDPDDLKRAIMKLSTKNGDTIRTYYINLEKLVRLYAEYCLYFNHREAQRKISSLEQLMADLKLQNETIMAQNNELLGQNDDMAERMDGVQSTLDVVQDKLDIAVEDRAPRVHTTACRERFVLFRKNDGSNYPYYVIRGQKGYCDRTLTKYKVIYPKLIELVDLTCQPNPRSLYIRFRERHISPKSKDKIRFKTDGNNISLNGYSEDILINILKKSMMFKMLFYGSLNHKT